MRTIPTRETRARRERVLAGNSLLANIHLESGLFSEQRLTCANHTGEDIVLNKIGWKNFICPKCGSDYSIGRKITVLV